MTLDETIKHCEKEAEKNEEMCRIEEVMGLGLQNTEMMKYAREHKQLAEWLKELKQLREQELVLDKIRDEIEEIEINGQIRDVECFSAGVNVALKIIDKYKLESEDKK